MRRGYSLFYESVQLLRPVDLHVRDIFGGECDVEILEIVVVCHVKSYPSYDTSSSVFDRSI